MSELSEVIEQLRQDLDIRESERVGRTGQNVAHLRD